MRYNKKYLWGLILIIIINIFPLNVFATSNISYKEVSARIEDTKVIVKTIGKVNSDDNLIHLYAQEVYEYGIQGKEVSKIKNTNSIFTFSLNQNNQNSVLYCKFQSVIKKNGKMIPIGNALYIENPEAAATKAIPRMDNGKKGILPDFSNTNEVEILKDLGINQISYNLPLGDLMSGGGINYSYNGKLYTFNKNIIEQYDNIISLMNDNNIQVTLILLNNINNNDKLIHPNTYDDLIHPLSKEENSNIKYYAFNTTDKISTDSLKSVASFLSERYSDKGHGTVDNWIIGNEINAKQEWNYMNNDVSITKYTYEYARAFRIFYNAIKSTNSNAKVYTCIDNEYAVPDGTLHFAGKSFLQEFNKLIKKEGNLNWGVAVHPYNYPLTDPSAWTMLNKSQVNNTQSSKYITMQNINIFTDFLKTEDMLSPDKEVRSIICSEQGYTSTAGEEFQAVSIVYGYNQAVKNPYIDGFILNRQTDASEEIEQGLALGIIDLDGNKKMGYDFYKNADNLETLNQVNNIVNTVGHT